MLRLSLQSHDSSLHVEIEESDIHSVFLKFDAINVRVVDASTAVIAFRNIIGAYLALSMLNGLELPSQEVTIRLQWERQEAAASFTARRVNIQSHHSSYNAQNNIENIPLAA